MLNVLEQASNAVQQRNWSLVIQCLLNLPLASPDAESGIGKSERLSAALGDRDQVLNLALAVLNAGDFQERWDIAKIIPKLGESAIAPLIEILQDEDADLELRWFVIRILGGFNHPLVVTSLLDFLKTAEDAELASMAAATLSSLGETAIEAVSSLLSEPESRRLATKALAQIRSPQTIPWLLSVVDDLDVAVRATAIEALSSFHDPRVIPVLKAALNDLATTVRKEAVIGLGLRGNFSEEIDLITELRPLLYDFNLEVCQQAAIALGRLGTEQAVLVINEVLSSTATPIALQSELIRVLGWVGTSTSVECLQKALSVATQETALEIVRVLGRLDEPIFKAKAAQILSEFLNSQHPALQSNLVKQAIAQSWGELGEIMAIDSLVEFLADPSLSVRLHAIASLKNFPDSYQKLAQLAAKPELAPALKEGIVLAMEEWQH